MNDVHENQIRNLITLLLIHYLADTGLTPSPDRLPEVYKELIDALTEQLDEDALWPVLAQVWDEGFSEAETHIERDEPIRNPYTIDQA